MASCRPFKYPEIVFHTTHADPPIRQRHNSLHHHHDLEHEEEK